MVLRSARLIRFLCRKFVFFKQRINLPEHLVIFVDLDGFLFVWQDPPRKRPEFVGDPFPDGVDHGCVLPVPRIAGVLNVVK